MSMSAHEEICFSQVFVHIRLVYLYCFVDGVLYTTYHALTVCVPVWGGLLGMTNMHYSITWNILQCCVIRYSISVYVLYVLYMQFSHT